MDGKNPFDYPLTIYLLIIAVAAWGGVVSALGKHRRGEQALTLFYFIGELATSGFTGLLGFWICQSFGLDLLWSAIAAALFGHLGPKTMPIAEAYILKKLDLVRGDITKDD